MIGPQGPPGPKGEPGEPGGGSMVSIILRLYNHWVKGDKSRNKWWNVGSSAALLSHQLSSVDIDTLYKNHNMFLFTELPIDHETYEACYRC